MKVASHFLYLYFILKAFLMRIILIVLVFLFAFSLRAQKPANPIFSKKSFPKFSVVDSLSKKTDNYFFDKISDFRTNKSSITQSNSKMPIFKPDYQISMPVYGVNPTKALFLKVYPANKD